MTDVRGLSAHRRLLEVLQVELDAATTRVMVTPVLGRVPVKQGDLDALQVRLHDITGPTPVVVCGTAPLLKRADEAAGGERQAEGAMPALSGQQVTLLLVKVEVDDPATVELVRCKVAALDVGWLWNKLPCHKAAGSAMHQVDMVGHVYVATDSSNLAGCRHVADIMEEYYIDKYNALGPHGYNIVPGAPLELSPVQYGSHPLTQQYVQSFRFQTE
ncbi:hypothetical protein VOLCADRAFT_90162 [Volvox carteri f. nagariensis]|uniref:Uncharacterized protein n=1 Tax=Volvox carteri f. nagariensis TaxID=3068 RepID=D8TTM7_VOLCA|nr:uncharacterized protein VOLCADRAFT_90162 [Volvox carteri f. nagariensis]EFJ49336.1 hypothetical protein VOLCADRAFT_90162 [Volvox carteri f. nagariensis]|eukprot:XP_002949784.1 hypothetical protein VOLCADRAFT_90162 [Volvox carteri f. nagariensis]